MTPNTAITALAMMLIALVSIAALLWPLVKTQTTKTKPIAITITMAIAAIIAPFILSLWLYTAFGAFTTPDQPLAQRQAEINAQNAIAQNRTKNRTDALAQAQAHAAANPDDIEALFNLADAAADANQSEIEINTLKNILQKTNNPLVKTMIGEALARQADGIITKNAWKWIQDGLLDAPNDWRGRYLKGLYLSQTGDDQTALKIWSQLAQETRTQSPQDVYPIIEAAIINAANRLGTPSQDYLPTPIAETSDIAAPDIESMVAGLEAELVTNKTPQNLENSRPRWLMLIRSLTQINAPKRRDNAIKRYLAIMPRTQQDLPILLGFVELLLPLDRPPDQDLPPILTPILKEARSIAPNHHSTLFFSGLVARNQGNQDALKDYWGRLIKQIDPETPLYTLLKQELEKNTQ